MRITDTVENIIKTVEENPTVDDMATIWEVGKVRDAVVTLQMDTHECWVKITEGNWYDKQRISRSKIQYNAVLGIVRKLVRAYERLIIARDYS